MFRTLPASLLFVVCAISTVALSASEKFDIKPTLDCVEDPDNVVCFPTTDSLDCEMNPYSIECIQGPDPADLPGQPIGPVPLDPGGQPEIETIYLVCTLRVLVNNATLLSQTQVIRECPVGSSRTGFSRAQSQMLQGTPVMQPNFPKCNQQGNVIRLLYPWARGITFMRPEIGECLDTSSNVLFSRPF